MKKKVLSLLLALVLLLGMVPATALAAEAEDADLPAAVDLEEPAEVVEDIEEVFLTEDPAEPEPAEAVILTEEETLIAEPLDGEEPEPTAEPGEPAVIAEGTCGAEGNEENVTWVLTNDGVLTISGSGAMVSDWSQPWENYVDQITSVVIKEGVTNIGTFTFGLISALNSVSIAPSVTTIEAYAFAYSGLTEVELYPGVSHIEEMAFDGCLGLSLVKFHGTAAQFDRISIKDGNDAFTKAERQYLVDDPSALVKIDLSGEWKTVYTVGEPLDVTGMTVTATYGDGTTGDVTAEAVFSGFDSAKAGEQTVTVIVGQGDEAAFAYFKVLVIRADGSYAVPMYRDLGGESIYNVGDDSYAIDITKYVDATGLTDLTYQWYSNSTESTEGATALTDASSVTPSTAEVGTMYYFCHITAKDKEDRIYWSDSGFRKVVVNPCTIPAGGNTNGYIKSLELKVYSDTLAALDFDPAVTEYETNLFSNPDVNVFLTDPGMAESEDCYFQFRFNGRKSASQDDEQVYSDMCTFSCFSSNQSDYARLPMGGTGTLSIIVGKKTDTTLDGTIDMEDAFETCDVYNITVHKFPLIKSLSLKDNSNTNIPVSPAISEVNLYNTDTFEGVSRSDEFTMNLSFDAAEGLRLFVGEKEFTASLNNEPFKVSDFNPDENGTADIPIKFVCALPEGGTSECVWHLRITWSHDFPVITQQSETAFTVEKDTEQLLFVTAEEPAQGALSYQWYKGSLIQGATESTYIVPGSEWAGEQSYFCIVTNTVGDKTFTTKSNTFKVTTNLTYVHEPEIHTQPGIYAKLQGSIFAGTYKTEYSAGAKLDDLYFGMVERGDNGRCSEPGTLRFTDADHPGVKFYYNSQPSLEGAVPIEGTLQQRMSGSVESKYRYISSTSMPVGDWYVCMVVTAYSAEDPTMSASTVSDYFQVHVTPLDYGFEGSGTEEDPYLLKTAEDFATLKKGVETDGFDFGGMWFAMANDISLPEGWTSIGVSIPFAGNLDGAGHTLSYAKGSSPLFDKVGGITVKNLGILGEEINGCGLINTGNVLDSIVTLENITLKNGTSTLKSGLLPGSVSSRQGATIVGCKAEQGVTIGYTGDESRIGTFIGQAVGTLTDCESYADVRGANWIGGLAGENGSAMGACYFTNCTFGGTVTGDTCVGGIIGRGYENPTAPNTRLVRIDGCTVSGKVSGTKNVGGLMGSEGGLAQSYDAASAGSLTGNTVTCTLSGSENVGALAGLYSHLDRYTVFEDNAYLNTYKPFGRVYHVDTSGVSYGWHDGVFYFDSSRTDYTDEQWEEISNALWIGWEDTGRNKPGRPIPDRNRFDDPLGVGGSGQVTVTKLTLSGDFKTEYLVGEALDTSGMIITAKYSDGTEKAVDPSEVTFNGFDTSTPGEKEVAVVFGGAAAYFTITVKAPEGSINVKLSILGDTLHDDGEIHTLKGGNLITWLEETEFTVDSNATVWDLLLKAFEEHGFTFTYYMSLGTEYIDSVTFDGVTLKEKDNNPNSGWQYTINGKDSSNGVRQQPLVEGDVICFHWTDDYTQEFYGDDDTAVYEVQDMIDALPDPEDVTLDDEEAIEAAREAYENLTDEQKEKVGEEYVQKLEAVEAALEELKAAGKVKVTGVSLTLKGQIGIYIYAQMPEGAATAKLTYPKTTEVKEYKLDKNKSYYIEDTDTYKFLYENVPAKEMTQPLELEVFDENGNALPITHVRLGDYGTKFTCQAVDYCNTIIENPDQPDKLKDLVKAILNYGQCAQLQFGYDVDNLANPEGYLAEEMKTVQADPANDAEIPANASDVGWEYGTLSLKGAVNANLYFSKAITAKDETGKDYTVKAKSGGKWSITVDNIPAKNLGDKFTVVAAYGGKTATIKYCAMSYINAVLAQEDNDNNANLKELCKAMILYNQYAKAYFNK